MRRRILTAILAVAAASVLALAVPLAIGAADLYRDDELLSLERDATAAARGFDVRAEPGDPVEFSPSADALAAYDREGRRLGGEGPLQADALVEQTLQSGRVTERHSGDPLTVAVPILASEKVVGAIRAARSTHELSERILRMRLTIVGAAIVIIGLAAIAALALTRRLTGPINRLSEMARGIEDGTPPKRSTHSGIPEIDTVADALNQSATRLGELVARERAFSANASHQLRTPLAALRLELESRELRGADMDEPLRQIDRLDDTIDTLLAAARDQQREREPFDVSSLLDEVRVAWAGPLADGGRAFVLAAPRDLHPARAARGAVREILWILVDNAVRHGDGTVRVQARSVDGSVAIDVADQGPGVADPSQIFARRSGSGRGIGLALARALAEADDARLDLVDATPGRTTFTLLLPAGTQPPGAA